MQILSFRALNASESKVSRFLFRQLLALACAILVIPCPAATLYYDPDLPTSTGWLGNHWSTTGNPGTFTAAWADDSDAVFTGAGRTVLPNGNVSVGDITNNTSGEVRIASTGGDTYTFTLNDTVIAGNTGGFGWSSRVSLSGNFSYSGAGLFTMDGINHGTTAFAGTATISGSFTQISNSSWGSTSAHYITTAAQFRTMANAGSVTVNGGQFQIEHNANVTLNQFSGSGGTLISRFNSSTTLNHLTVDQATDTTFAGSVNGGQDNDRLMLTKSGPGNLTLSGTISNLRKTTTVNGGGLFLTGAGAKTFGDEDGTTAILVDAGGLLGGTGTISTLAGDNVVVASGGSLAAGLVGSAGITTYSLGAGAILDISAAAGGGGGWLRFDLGAPIAAGVDYDQIAVTTGSLAIGSGLLNFSDFQFNALAGFDDGTYVLFNNAALSGALAATGLSGQIDGKNAWIGLDNQNIILSVVPEPRAWALLGMGLAVFTARFLRRRARA